MCGVVAAYVLFFLVKRRELLFESIRVLHFEVTISVVASHKNHLFICVAEADLGARYVWRRVCQCLLPDLLSLLPLPDVDGLVRVAGQGD